jgi:hypothetical protein
MICNFIPFCDPHENIVYLMVVTISYQLNGRILDDQKKAKCSNKSRHQYDVNDNFSPIINKIEGNWIRCNANSKGKADYIKILRGILSRK